MEQLLLPEKFSEKVYYPRRTSLWKKIFYLCSATLFLALLVPVGMYFYFASADKLDERVRPESSKIYDRNGVLLYEVFGEVKRTPIPLSDIPEHVKQATIAIEDKDFYSHSGIDLSGIARAAWVNLRAKSVKQGGSTISQQFVRNAVLTRERTFTRKIKEVVLTFQLEHKHTKDEILELYLNEIPYGANAYGIEAASQTYFQKEAKTLTLSEAAYLAALPKAPTYFSPYGVNREALDTRADLVLSAMADQGYITAEQKELAAAENVEFKKIITRIKAPHFVMYVQDLLAAKYGENVLREGGLQVMTSLDMNLQTMAEEIVAKHVAKNEKNFSAGNASLVAIDPQTGQILAMVGSRDYFDDAHDGAVNVALQPRQPGSSFKPYVYATAFKEGMSPATLLFDVQTNFGRYGSRDYIPQNYNGSTRGPISIRQALQGSLNIPAVKALMLTGIDDSINTAESLGITTLKDRERYGPSLVLGGGEVKLLEHAAAFGVFAAGGVYAPTTAFIKVTDSQGKILQQFSDKDKRKALDPEIAYQINHVLSDNEARMFIFSNRNNVLTIPGQTVAAKTGTTQEFRDAWTVGYTPSLAAGVWVGNNDNTPMRRGADGLYVAAPIWNEFMKRALAEKPRQEFPRPVGIVEMDVDALTGKLPTEYTPKTKREIFARVNVPKERDDFHVAIDIGGITEVATVAHSEKPDDPAWENPVRAWALAHNYAYGPLVASADGGINLGDSDPSIVVTLPQKISSVPWEIKVESAAGPENIAQIDFFIDKNLEISHDGGVLVYASNKTLADGPHVFSVNVKTNNGRLYRKIYKVEFAMADIEPEAQFAAVQEDYQNLGGVAPEPPATASTTLQTFDSGAPSTVYLE